MEEVGVCQSCDSSNMIRELIFAAGLAAAPLLFIVVGP